MSTSTLHPIANVPAQHLETPVMHFFRNTRSCEWHFMQDLSFYLPCCCAIPKIYVNCMNFLKQYSKNLFWKVEVSLTSILRTLLQVPCIFTLCHTMNVYSPTALNSLLIIIDQKKLEVTTEQKGCPLMYQILPRISYLSRGTLGSQK